MTTRLGDGFVYPDEHRWRQDNFLAGQREVVRRLRDLADRVEREHVRLHPSPPAGMEHYGDEVTVAALIVSDLTQGFNHACLPLDALIQSAHECSIIRWSPDMVRAKADAADLARLVERSAAVLASPSGKKARQALAETVSRVQARQIAAVSDGEGEQR